MKPKKSKPRKKTCKRPLREEFVQAVLKDTLDWEKKYAFKRKMTLKELKQF